MYTLVKVVPWLQGGDSVCSSCCAVWSLLP